MPTTHHEPLSVHDLLTVQEVADRLNVSVRTVYRLLSRGELPQPVRFNRKLVRWKRCDMDRYIDSLSA
jgi:excisionase family DNA binding protein